MNTTEQLVNSILAAHGGLDTWNRYQTLKAHVQIGGLTWSIKGHENALSEVQYTASLHEQKGSWDGIFEPGLHSTFVPGKVALLDEKGDILEELLQPRDSFKGHTIETPWTRLQTVYFSSYATWNYLTAPFNFLMSGVQVNELKPWIEKGETLRRLEVTYPDGFATHSKRQVFYYDEHYLLKRHDYWPEVLGGSSATQIVEEYKEFSGLKTGTKRRIYILNDADNSYQIEPVLVSIDVLAMHFA